MSPADQAKMFFEHGQSCRAVSIYKKLILTEPTVENMTILAELYMQQGLTEDAIDIHLKMANAKPGLVQ
jgi:hypothetical protein